MSRDELKTVGFTYKHIIEIENTTCSKKENNRLTSVTRTKSYLSYSMQSRISIDEQYGSVSNVLKSKNVYLLSITVRRKSTSIFGTNIVSYLGIFSSELLSSIIVLDKQIQKKFCCNSRLD